MKKTLLIVMIAVLALGAFGVGAVSAQGGNPPANPYGYGRGPVMGGGRGGYGPMRDYVEKALASKLGLTEAQVEQELTTKPMYQVALDHGVQQADLAAFMADIHKTASAAAVKDGVITQAQADAMLQRMAQTGFNFGNCTMGGGYGRGAGMMGGRWQNQNP